MQSTIRTTRTLPTRRLLATTPTGRPASAVDRTTNLGAQTPGGYGGTGGPIPQAGGTPPPPKKSNLGLIVGVGALVAGGATYYMTQTADPAQAVKDDFHRLEAGAKHEVDALRTGARSSSDPLGPQPGAGTREAERYADKLRSPDDRYGAEQLKDSLERDAGGVKREVKAWGDALKSDEKKAWSEARGEARAWGDALKSDEKAAWKGFRDETKAYGDMLRSDEKKAWKPFRDEVHAWLDALSSGPNAKEAFSEFSNEIAAYRNKLRSRDGEYGVEQVEAYLHGRGLPSHTVVPGGNPYLDWIGGGKSVRRTSAERKLNQLEDEGKSYFSRASSALKSDYESAKSSASHAAADAKAEASSWFNWGENKAENAKDKAGAEWDRAKQGAKDEANSWSSWTSAKASDAQAAVSSAASSVESASRDAYNATTNAASSAYNATTGAAQNAGDKVKDEGKSWWNWSGDKAADGKQSLKEGLLTAEHSVERGAQDAQRETKKL
ncbi:hypothetical protein JCM6882_003262 [Rhodosporidiobolus microsporus]